MTASSEVLDPILFNPKRFAIAVLLYLHGPMTIAELKKALNLSWGDVDSNIRRLKSAGYVTTRRVFASRPQTLVILTRKGRSKLEELMDKLETMLSQLREARDDNV